MGGIFSKKKEDDLLDENYDNCLSPEQEKQLQEDLEEIDRRMYKKCK
jgi:hypothetical protein